MQIPLILNLWKMAPVSFFVNKEEGIAKHSWVAKSRGPWKWSLEVQTKRRLSGKQQFLLNDVTWLDCRAILPPAPARIMSDKEGIESTNGSCLAVLFSRGILRLMIDAHSDLQLLGYKTPVFLINSVFLPVSRTFSTLDHLTIRWWPDDALMTIWQDWMRKQQPGDDKKVMMMLLGERNDDSGTQLSGDQGVWSAGHLVINTDNWAVVIWSSPDGSRCPSSLHSLPCLIPLIYVKTLCVDIFFSIFYRRNCCL